MKTIGERIRDRRNELGISQQELAELVGYSGKAAISKIESGDRELRQSKIRPIAEALKTTTEYIMGWDADQEEPEEPDEKTKRFAELIAQLDDSDKEDLIKYMEFLISRHDR